MVSIAEPVESPMNDVTRPDPVLRARDLVPAIAAAAAETERLRHIPEPLLDQLHAARLFRMLYPRSPRPAPGVPSSRSTSPMRVRAGR